MPSRTTRRSRALVAAGTIVAVMMVGAQAACRPSSDADLQTGQALVELGDAVNDLRQENSLLQQELDSLRTVVARQDTLIRQIANLAGLR